MQQLFIAANIIGLPCTRAVNKFVREERINDVVLSPTVSTVYFLTAEN